MRKITTAAAAMLVLTLAACEPEGSAGGTPTPNPKPPAGVAPPRPKHNDGNGNGAQPAPVQRDPSAHNTQPGEVDLHLSWTHPETARTPLCEWSKNGVSHPCNNMVKAVREADGLYYGIWEHTETGVAGDVFTLNAEGLSGTDPECAIQFKAVYHEGVTKGWRCGVSVTLS